MIPWVFPVLRAQTAVPDLITVQLFSNALHFLWSYISSFDSPHASMYMFVYVSTIGNASLKIFNVCRVAPFSNIKYPTYIRKLNTSGHKSIPREGVVGGGRVNTGLTVIGQRVTAEECMYKVEVICLVACFHSKGKQVAPFACVSLGRFRGIRKLQS